MSDEDWDAEDFEPRDVKLPSADLDKWSGEDEVASTKTKSDVDKGSEDVDKQAADSGAAQKRKKKLLKERIAEIDEKDKKLLEEKKKQEEVKLKTREERRQQTRQKAAANLESALEAFGFDKNSLDAEVVRVSNAGTVPAVTVSSTVSSQSKPATAP
jgi:hypothetical protein